MCLETCNDNASMDSQVLSYKLGTLESKLTKSLGCSKSLNLNIACWLYSIYVEKLYFIAGYKNIYDYSLDKFGLKKSTVSEFIHTVKRFGEKMIGSDDWSINVKYKGFNISQLVLMSRYSDSELHTAALLPTDSVRQVRNKLRQVAVLHRQQTLSQQSGDYIYYDAISSKKQIELKAAGHEVEQHRRTVTIEINNLDEYVNGAEQVADWLARGWQIELKVTGYVTED